MSTFQIIDFYNQGAQAVVSHVSGDMSHTFIGDVGGDDEQIGYVPQHNSGQPAGWAFDLLTHEGVEYLLLKAGYVYDVTITMGEDSTTDVISAESGHLSLPLPDGADVDVEEHVPVVVDPVWLTPETVEDLMAIPVPHEPTTITVSEAFAAQYNVEAGEHDADELIALLIELGAIVIEED